MQQNGSRLTDWRQGACGAAMHCVRSLISGISRILNIASFEGLTATTFVAVLDIASFSGAGALSRATVAGMAACIVYLLKENQRLSHMCSMTSGKPTADAGTMNEVVCTPTQDVATEMEPSGSSCEDNLSTCKQASGPEVQQRPQPGSPCGPKTPTHGPPSSLVPPRSSSVVGKSDNCHQHIEQTATTSEPAAGPSRIEPVGAGEDTALLPAVNLTCKTLPTPAAAAQSSLAESAHLEGPSTPIRLSDAATTTAISATAACGEGAATAQAPVPPPLPPKQSSNGNNLAVSKPPPAAPPPPPMPVTAPKARQLAAAAAAPPPPPPPLPSTGRLVTARPPPPPPLPPGRPGAPCSATSPVKPLPASKTGANRLPPGVVKAPTIAQIFQQVRRWGLEQAGQQVIKGGSKAAAAKAAAPGAEDAKAALLADLHSKIGTSAKITAAFEKYKPELVKAAAAINSFKPDCLEAVPEFIEPVDKMLACIEFEQAVLQKFGAWPGGKYDVIREVSMTFRSLKSLIDATKAWRPPSDRMDAYKLSDLRSKIKQRFGVIDTVIKNIRFDPTNLMKRSKDYSLPWDPPHTNQLIDELKLASLNLARGYMEAAMQETAKLGAHAHVAQQLRQKSMLTVLGETVRFMQSVQEVVGGLDTEANQLFASVAAKWEQVVAGAVVLQPATELAQRQQQPVVEGATEPLCDSQQVGEQHQQRQQQQVGEGTMELGI